MVKKAEEMRVCDLPTDYCAFMFAIVLVHLVVIKEEIGIQKKLKKSKSQYGVLFRKTKRPLTLGVGCDSTYKTFSGFFIKE